MYLEVLEKKLHVTSRKRCYTNSSPFFEFVFNQVLVLVLFLALFMYGKLLPTRVTHFYLF